MVRFVYWFVGLLVDWLLGDSHCYLIVCLVGRFESWLVGWAVRWLVAWLLGWFVRWVDGWLVGRFAVSLVVVVDEGLASLLFTLLVVC